MREHDRLRREHDHALRMLALAVDNYLTDRDARSFDVVVRRAHEVRRTQAAVDAYFVEPYPLIG